VRKLRERMHRVQRKHRPRCSIVMIFAPGAGAVFAYCGQSSQTNDRSTGSVGEKLNQLSSKSRANAAPYNCWYKRLRLNREKSTGGLSVTLEEDSSALEGMPTSANGLANVSRTIASPFAVALQLADSSRGTLPIGLLMSVV
jgi:hypothetical protein